MELACCSPHHHSTSLKFDNLINQELGPEDVHNEGIMQFGFSLTGWNTISDLSCFQVICSLCGTEQNVQQKCIHCGVCMGKYFCRKCNFFDDDDSKLQYHCDGCGICRTGGKDNFFHCYKCGCCYSVSMKESHVCVEGAMHHNCPVCCEFLFDSTKDITVLHCGHTIHLHCLIEMRYHLRYACPLCSKSIFDMTKVWEKLDEEIAATPMPQTYGKKLVWILCNDCGVTSEVKFHIVGHKCKSCYSYNTRQIVTASSVNSCAS